MPDDEIVTFRRIQFTPDLLPSDVTGTTIFDPNTNRFFFRPGPVFAHIVLADEINRTSPKVQSAMLEAMAEKQVTVDNRTRKLDELFFVIATQNPLDLAGTFPLPSRAARPLPLQDPHATHRARRRARGARERARRARRAQARICRASRARRSSTRAGRRELRARLARGARGARRHRRQDALGRARSSRARARARSC